MQQRTFMAPNFGRGARENYGEKLALSTSSSCRMSTSDRQAGRQAHRRNYMQGLPDYSAPGCVDVEAVLLWPVIPNSAMGLIIVVFTSSLAPLDHRLDEPCCIDTRFPSPLCRPSALDCLFRAVDTNEAPFLSRGISREANLNPATRTVGTATTTDGSKLGGLSVLAVVLFSTYYIFG